MRRRAKLHLVGQDTADVFNDLDQRRAPMAVLQRRAKTAETFARIPHNKGLALYRSRIGRGAWAILIELDRLILKAGGRNPVRLWAASYGMRCDQADPRTGTTRAESGGGG